MTNTVVPLNLDAFLASVERRAFRMALLATRNQAEALDLVQDAMLRLCQKYAQQPAEQWPALFQRILQNRILDWHRRQTRTQRWFLPWKGAAEDEADGGIDTIAADREQNPERLLAQADDMETVLHHLEQLPIRQQQAFLLRVWEGLDVRSTALAMACSESAVKTHFHRATRSLRNALETLEQREDTK